jgi:polyhydroxybutyrate depolymerase
VQRKERGRPLAWLLGLGLSISAAAWIVKALLGGTSTALLKEPDSARSFRVITRAGHERSEPAPILFALHAYALAPDLFVWRSLLELLAVKARGIILVVPQGTRDSAGRYFWNASAACCGAELQRPDDLAYLQHVLDEVRRRFTVDSAQVFALGVSNGGFMAHRWACLPDTPLTAIASISGAAPGAQDPPCTPSKPISVLQIHGDADEVIAYGGGRMRDAEYPSARDSLAPYLTVAQIRAAPRVHRTDSVFFGTIRKQDWSAPEARISLWTVEHGRHQLRAAQARALEVLDFLQGRTE